MISYSCKYTPVELFAAYGGECLLLNREAPDFEYAEGLTHSHFCCHAKAVLEESRSGLLEGLALVNCCDSLRRVYDVTRSGHGFYFLLDLPHHDDGCARSRLRAELVRLAEAYEAFSGRAFEAAKFRAAFSLAPALPSGPFLAVLGARVGAGLLSALRGRSSLPIADFTCGGHRSLPPPPEEMCIRDRHPGCCHL